jgi:dTDP-4-dehydrorhamnose reductase
MPKIIFKSKISQFMAVILITGANGQLGSELKVVSKNYINNTFIFTDIDTLDITNPEQTAEFIHKVRPDWIINCAAYNMVDKAESDPDTAMATNGTAVKNITEVIRDSECKFIHFSSDYIFDGRAKAPYKEYAIPNPLSAYGRSKLTGEKHALIHQGSMVIRTSWLYSSFGNNFVRTILSNATEKESLRVVSDQTGTPTYAADLAEAVMKIVSGVIRNQIAMNGGIYHYSNEGQCSWYEFAAEIIREAAITCKVIPILTSDYPLAAQRPAYSVMDKSKIKENYSLSIPDWKSSLKKCIKLLK